MVKRWNDEFNVLERDDCMKANVVHFCQTALACNLQLPETEIPHVINLKLYAYAQKMKLHMHRMRTA